MSSYTGKAIDTSWIQDTGEVTYPNFQIFSYPNLQNSDISRYFCCALNGKYGALTRRQRTNGDATCTCRYMQATICGSKPVHKAVLIRVQTLVLQHTCPPAGAFLIPFSQYRSLHFYKWEHIPNIPNHKPTSTLCLHSPLVTNTGRGNDITQCIWWHTHILCSPC